MKREIAERYCREQLAIMDGSPEAGMKRIGTDRFEKMVQDVLKTFSAIERAHESDGERIMGPMHPIHAKTYRDLERKK